MSPTLSTIDAAAPTGRVRLFKPGIAAASSMRAFCNAMGGILISTLESRPQLPTRADRETAGGHDKGGPRPFSGCHPRAPQNLLHLQVPAEKVENGVCDLFAARLQGEVAGVEQLDFGIGKVALECFGAGRNEGRIVLAPDREQGDRKSVV